MLIFFVSTLIFYQQSGIETNKFNNLINQKINENKKFKSLNLMTIKFKLDIKNFSSLFLDTISPNIDYKDIY